MVATVKAKPMNNTFLARRVKNLRVTLYAFHLRHSLAQGPQQVMENATHLWDKLVELGEKFLPLPELISLREHLSCYQNGQYNPYGEKRQRGSELQELLEGGGFLPFQPVPLKNGFDLGGLIYPWKLHDAYAADLRLQYKTSEVQIADLSYLNPQGCLLPHKIQASLGQTLLVFAEMGEDAKADRQVADACVAALMSEGDQPPLECIAQGRLFASPIFEYDLLDKSELHSASEQCHILVWLNHGQPKTLTMAEKANHPLLNLLCCRHKIINAYHQSRQSNQAARRRYSQLEQEVQHLSDLVAESSKQLQQLKGLLSQMPLRAFQYACDLRDMEDCGNAIATQTKSYDGWLKEIQAISQAGDNLQFLLNFSERTCNQFQTQIQVDLTYLTPGRDMFPLTISTIRGMVGIEQAQLDLQWQQNQEKLLHKEISAQPEPTIHLKPEKDLERNLQKTIQAIGAGVAAGAIVASSSAYIIAPWQSPSLFSSLFSFLLSLILSTFAAAGMWWIVKRWQE